MSCHLLPFYEPTDHKHVCCLYCLLFSSKNISWHQQYLFYVHSLLESSKTARCIAFDWSLKKYEVPIICLWSSYEIVRAQTWSTGSHMATHCSQQDRGLSSPAASSKGTGQAEKAAMGSFHTTTSGIFLGTRMCRGQARMLACGRMWESDPVRWIGVKDSSRMTCALNESVALNPECTFYGW